MRGGQSTVFFRLYVGSLRRFFTGDFFARSDVFFHDAIDFVDVIGDIDQWTEPPSLNLKNVDLLSGWDSYNIKPLNLKIDLNTMKYGKVVFRDD